MPRGLPSWEWDERTTARVAAWFRARPVLYRLAGWFSDLSSSVVVVPAGLVLWRWGGSALWQAVGVRLLVGSLASSLVTLTLKGIFRRQRPAGAQGFYLGLDKHSFPSGHTLRAVCLVWWLAPLWPTGWSTAWVAIWAVFVSTFRVGTGAHHVSDVLAGWAFGSATGALLLWLATQPIGALGAS